MNKKLELLCGNLPQDIDCAMITSGLNRLYYTGFPSSAGTLLVLREQCYFITDMRYIEAARAKVDGCAVQLQEKLYDQINGILKKHGVKTVAIEADEMSLSRFELLRGKINAELLPDARLSELITKQRSVKTTEEIALIRRSQVITDKTFTHIQNFIKAGKTELEIALEMEFYSRAQGSEEAAFAFIVASGENSSRPHAVPTDRAVRDGDFIVMDYGSTVEGYRSDMTRTVAVGSVSDKQREVYELVLRAQLAALDQVRAGEKCVAIDKIARDIIDATPYKGLFGHGLGHSLGLAVHEDPRFSTECTVVLEAGVVMSVEPGIYIPGEFGVRIEDLVVATADGCDNFTTSPKALCIL